MEITPPVKSRNLEIVRLINRGIKYRDLSRLFKLSVSRIEGINARFNSAALKKDATYCVRCSKISRLSRSFALKDRILNICTDCVKEIRSM